MTATVRRWDAMGMAAVALMADRQRLRLEFADTCEGGSRWSLFMPIKSVVPMYLRCAQLIRDAVRRGMLTADQAGELTQGPRLRVAVAAVQSDGDGRAIVTLRSPDHLQVAFELDREAAAILASQLAQIGGFTDSSLS